MDGANRHAADRLHDVRAQIRTLEDEADELRTYLIVHPEDCTGDEYEASIGSYQRRHVDWEGLERAVGRELLQRFVGLRAITVIRLRECDRRDAA